MGAKPSLELKGRTPHPIGGYLGSEKLYEQHKYH